MTRKGAHTRSNNNTVAPTQASLVGIEPGPVEHTQERSAKAVLIHQLLCMEYGCPISYFHALDPLSELIAALLSHRTRNRDAAQAFRTLRDRFPHWEAVRDAPVEHIHQAILACTWPEQKAPRIQSVLRRISETCETKDSAMTLDFLADWPVEQARRWLESLPGVGPKTSAAVISFSTLRDKALPVDSHHHRVAVRLGLIDADVTVGLAHRILEAQLPADWDAQRVYDNHQVMMRHGQHVCTWRQPDCGRCVVLEYCPYGQGRMMIKA